MKNNVYQIDKNKKVIVYFLTYDNREFKGVAKCSPEDVFDEEKGKKIAQLKALINVRKYFIKETKYLYYQILNLCPWEVRFIEETKTTKTYYRYQHRFINELYDELNTHKKYLKKYEKQLRELI